MKHLGKYEIVELIGSGAYAEVYKAMDTVLRRTVALKLLKPSLLSDDEAVARFLQEAQTAANLIHPHIAWVWDLGELDGRYYLAMRYIDGQSLDKVLKTKGQLSWDEAIKYITQISDALTFAHASSLVHRDIKPQNIMISPRDGAVLTDFGLVRAMEAGSIGTRTGALMGTPAYMAPEIWQGEPAGPAADQYSLACVLVEMLTGKPLFSGPTPPAVMRQHLMEGPHLPVSWPAGCPTGFTAIIQQALDQNPAERYPDIPAFMSALNVSGQPNAEAAAVLPTDEPWPPEQVVLQPTPVVSDLPPTPAESPLMIMVDRDPLASAVGSKLERSQMTPPPFGTSEQTTSTSRELSPRIAPSRFKLPGWAIALIALGGLALLAACVLGVAWAMNWLPGSDPTAVAVVNPTQTPRPQATATVKPTAKPTAKPTTKPTTRSTFSSTATSDPSIPPACTEVGQTWTSPVDGMTLVCVPAGEFLMGSEDKYYNDDDEMPQHTVDLDPYWIDQTEVTNAMFAEFVAATGYRTTAEIEGSGYVFRPQQSPVLVKINGRWVEQDMPQWQWVDGIDWQHPSRPDGDLDEKEDHPVVQVSWNDAEAYCSWAGRFLPSEAQWEKAARGNEGDIYPWGNQSPTSSFLNYQWNIGDTIAVGSYPAGASPYGIYDMAGNVWEWTADWYSSSYYSSQTNWLNPVGPVSGTQRIVRGGAWDVDGIYARAAHRYSYPPDHRVSKLGFRCALRIVP